MVTTSTGPRLCCRCTSNVHRLDPAAGSLRGIPFWNFQRTQEAHD